MLPLVSVIVPVYKVEPYLRKCLDSIIKQTWQKLEIILVDDGSPDDCGKICDEYAQKDKRIKVFHKQHGGLSDTRNYGIIRARGEYLGFVDSDDWIELNMYEMLVKSAVDNKADLVICGVFHEYTGKLGTFSPGEKKYSNNVDLVKALFKGKIGEGVMNKLYHKRCFTNIFFPEGHVYEEFATTYRICLNITNAVCISNQLYHYRMNREGSITQTCTLENMVDYWLAHKSRYDFFLRDSRFNTDKILIDKLLNQCACAIEKIWLHIYPVSKQDRYIFDWAIMEMQDFVCQELPVFGMCNWPLHLRFSVFMARFNNEFVFALLYFMCQGYKRLYCNRQ